MEKILIVGTGGLAREFTSWFGDAFDIIGYTSKNHDEHSQFSLPGSLYLGDDVTPDLVGTNLVVIAIDNPLVKKRIYERYSRSGFSFPSIIHSSSEVSNLATIEDGAIVSPQCTISPNAVIGKLAYVNFCCGIGHDSLIGDFVQINPGSQLGGFSKIGDQVLIGSGATVLQGVSIGDNATVASGSVVFAKVSEGATVMGNPAKRMRALEK